MCIIRISSSASFLLLLRVLLHFHPCTARPKISCVLSCVLSFGVGSCGLSSLTVAPVAIPKEKVPWWYFGHIPQETLWPNRKLAVVYPANKLPTSTIYQQPSLSLAAVGDISKSHVSGTLASLQLSSCKESCLENRSLRFAGLRLNTA